MQCSPMPYMRGHTARMASGSTTLLFDQKKSNCSLEASENTAPAQIPKWLPLWPKAVSFTANFLSRSNLSLPPTNILSSSPPASCGFFPLEPLRAPANSLLETPLLSPCLLASAPLPPPSPRHALPQQH